MLRAYGATTFLFEPSSTNRRNGLLVLVLVLVLLEPSLASCISHCATLALRLSSTVSKSASSHVSEQEGHRGARHRRRERINLKGPSLPAAPSISTAGLPLS
ncbi:hypothetical protein TgHK011_007523 [Trichoderma gracile]|nr:hypothetical protein TgHK011_007523 [Trichoderma gracile]